MVPIQLTMRNFMAYRETTLDFQGIHLAVLAGENGAGKSTLLDAMTWALWGKSRAGSDSALIQLGQNEMEVEFTFTLNDTVYRLIRKLDASRKRPQSSLSFQAEDAGSWRTLDGNSLRETQKKINLQLRLDYDTFINSSFLLQGRADEFTMKASSKRKQILGDILGLQIYDEYEKKARDYARAQEKEVAVIESKIDSIVQELVKEPEYRVELAEAQKREKTLLEERLAAETTEKEARQQYQELEYKQRELDKLERSLEDREADLAELNQSIGTTQQRISDYENTLARQSEIEEGVAVLHQARDFVKDWERRLQESIKLTTRQHALNNAFQKAENALKNQLNLAEADIKRLGPKVAGLEGQQQQLSKAQAELDTLEALAADRDKQNNDLTALREERATLDATNKQLLEEMKEIDARLTQLKEAGSECPVCRRPLDEEHRADVLEQFQTQGTIKGDTYRGNKTRLQEIDTTQTDLQKRLKAADGQLKKRDAVRDRVAQLTQSIADAQTAQSDLAAAQSQHADLTQQLETQAFAAEEVAKLAEVRAELATLGYDESAHSEAKKRVESLLHFEEESRTLAHASERLAEARDQLVKEQARHTKLTESIRTEREQVVQLRQDTAELPALRQQLNQALARLQDLEKEYGLAKMQVGAAEQKLKLVADQSKKRADLEDQLQEVRRVLGIYRELQVAFGRKGVQALLIETAIPEIEAETNNLLARMTDSRMHVRFETQREAKSSDSIIETLDIRISDELGSRDYEMYSGGEAFRVNFAIRIAISKLLARRAGARLQTLVIDEGFGTQDAQGRERLVEAINAIQEDFEKIIVITHIDELKDAFPARIDVWKTPEGSQLAIR